MQELIIEFLGSPAESSVDIIDNLVNLIFLELVKVYHSDLVTSQLNLGKRKMYGGHEIYRGQLQELHAGVCGGDV